jgi:hypothetical protein
MNNIIWKIMILQKIKKQINKFEVTMIENTIFKF